VGGGGEGIAVNIINTKNHNNYVESKGRLELLVIKEKI
jgi:hypothetical protein